MAGKGKSKTTTPKVRIADNGYKFPEQLPVGEKLIDSLKNEWLLGKAIARGGFGEIYEARPSLIKSNLPIKKNKDYEYVIKVDHQSGPLFCEMNFYLRAARHDSITKWMADKGIKFIGMPSYIAAGTHSKGSDLNKNGKLKEPTKYRFLVMPRFGSDLQKILDLNKFKLPLKTSYTIGIKVLDILEYIHSHGYIHADIKASNLLLSVNSKSGNQHDEIWLVDFGLVEKYLQGESSKHKPYEEDLRRANNGTIEFTSRDAHIGCFSRKGDIEILAYNLLSWLSGGRLPWMSNLHDKAWVKNMKISYMNRLDDLLAYAFQDTKTETVTLASSTKKAKTNSKSSQTESATTIPDGISEFFKQVIKMKYDDKPNYELLRSILKKAIVSHGEQYDGLFYLSESDKKKCSSTIKATNQLKESTKKTATSPLKRKYSSSKNSKKSMTDESSNNFSNISVIFDEDTDEEIVGLPIPKKPRKQTSNGTSNSRRSPTVLNAKIASNGRTKQNNGKSSPIQKTNGQLLNENGINKLNNETLNSNDLSNGDDSIDNSKRRRRNPSRKVKNNSQSDLNENIKLVKETPIRKLHVKNVSTVHNKSENQIVIHGKVYTNPTPAMVELFNSLNGKIK